MIGSELSVAKKAYTQFDPLEKEEDYKLPSNCAEFLAKYFETFLDEEAMAKVLEDCPFPNCDALQVPKLDDDWIDLLEDDKRNFPLIKADKNMARIQSTLIKVVAPHSQFWIMLDEVQRGENSP